MLLFCSFPFLWCFQLTHFPLLSPSCPLSLLPALSIPLLFLLILLASLHSLVVVGYAHFVTMLLASSFEIAHNSLKFLPASKLISLLCKPQLDVQAPNSPTIPPVTKAATDTTTSNNSNSTKVSGLILTALERIQFVDSKKVALLDAKLSSDKSAIKKILPKTMKSTFEKLLKSSTDWGTKLVS